MAEEGNNLTKIIKNNFLEISEITLKIKKESKQALNEVEGSSFTQSISSSLLLFNLSFNLNKTEKEFSQINWKSKKLAEQVNSSLNQSILLLANIKIIQIPQTIKINKINILVNF
uniref:Uncharacterized protein n=1 Tax=Meloidogyne enterolobii TaxID=390850 RepID=A0A6V7VTH1_MELEN|nr:unnamed protein product [Meloidogyne enterolobii]